jgi:methanogenic corrinoid protein MtbC1
MQIEKEQTLSAMENLELDLLNKTVQTLVELGCPTLEIEEVLQQGMKLVGERFAKGEYFLADLIVSGMMFKAALSLIIKETPSLQTDSIRGRILIGVMAGDIHDIGKDIIAQVLKVEQFDILDLGVDVPAEAFVQAAQKYKPDLIALGGIMSASVFEMNRVVSSLEEAGIYPNTPIIVGGTCVNIMCLDSIGAVSYAQGPLDIVHLCNNLLENKKNHE